jgi:hypothetical protein
MHWTITPKEYLMLTICEKMTEMGIDKLIQDGKPIPHNLANEFVEKLAEKISNMIVKAVNKKEEKKNNV